MPLKHAILAFLDLSPMSGYDLKKNFDHSVGHFWSASQSHIYKALEGVQQKGWAEVELVLQEGKPNRKDYQITSAGRAELRRWLITPLPLEPVREAWLIQIFFSHGLSNEEIAQLLESRMDAMRAGLEALRAEGQAAIDEAADQVGVERARQLWQLTLDYGIDYYEAELVWHEKTLARVRELPPLSFPASANTSPEGSSP